MNSPAPRIAPVQPADWTEEQRAVLEPVHREGRVYNVVATLARHWKAYRKFQVWSSHIMGDTQTLTPHDRELLILRTGWLCKSAYEWGQHVRIARRVGLPEDYFARIQAGADAPGWTAAQAALLVAADELHRDASISDATWARLSKTYSTEQLMDVVFTVGQYRMVSMALNSFRVAPDAGLGGF
jgi:alkylhydroperoxidase family enzyme